MHVSDKNPKPGVCLPIIVKFCADAPYNFTVFPNYIGHFGQLDAEEVCQIDSVILGTGLIRILINIFVGAGSVRGAGRRQVLRSDSALPLLDLYAQMRPERNGCCSLQIPVHG